MIYPGNTYRAIPWNPTKIAVTPEERPSDTNHYDVRKEHSRLLIIHQVSQEKRSNSSYPSLVSVIFSHFVYKFSGVQRSGREQSMVGVAPLRHSRLLAPASSLQVKDRLSKLVQLNSENEV